jgi:putative transposon-encoded protein
MKEPREITIKGYELIERRIAKSGNSAYLYLPVKYAGKKVAVVLLEEVGD